MGGERLEMMPWDSSFYDVSEKGRRDGVIAAGTCRLKRRDFV